MIEKKNENYNKAIIWAKDYLAKNTEPKELKYKPGVITHSDIDMVRTNLSRLIHSKGRAQQSAYRAIREFKIYLSQNLTQ
jgi:hypothetical protein